MYILIEDTTKLLGYDILNGKKALLNLPDEWDDEQLLDVFLSKSDLSQCDKRA